MKTSVIVPNHGRDISKLVESVGNDAELIVIDQGLERSEQRNIGIQKARGRIILWLDSDQAVSPGLIQEAERMIDAGYSSLYVPEMIVARSFFGRIRKFEREFYTGTAIDVPRFVRKAVCPLFDPALNGPEDADFGNRVHGLRGTTTRCLYHYDDIPFLEYCRKKAYYTKSMQAYARKWPADLCLDLKYRCWTVFVEKGKWRKLLRHPGLSLGILFLLIVRGVIYHANK